MFPNERKENGLMEVKKDLFGDPIPFVPKCKQCGHEKYNHRASNGACPFGRKDRTGGYSFHENQFYEPKPVPGNLKNKTPN